MLGLDNKIGQKNRIKSIFSGKNIMHYNSFEILKWIIKQVQNHIKMDFFFTLIAFRLVQNFARDSAFNK